MKKTIVVLIGFYMLQGYSAPLISNVKAEPIAPWGEMAVSWNVSNSSSKNAAEYSGYLVMSNVISSVTYWKKVDVPQKDGFCRTYIDKNMYSGKWDKSDQWVFQIRLFLKYCIVDLSAGHSTLSYPISYLTDEPKYGWTEEYKTTKLVLRLIEPGTFKMSGRAGDRWTEYDIRLTKPYYIGIFEVTQKQYNLVAGENPSCYMGDRRPVENVSYKELRGLYNWPTDKRLPTGFLGKLIKRTGGIFDLPTEAQWEYACRAGTESRFNNGGDTEEDLALLGRYGGNVADGRGGYSEHTEVGSYLPNNWGIYDMHGNVWEWCRDWVWNSPNEDMVDPLGKESGSERCYRGNCWRMSEYIYFFSSSMSSTKPENKYEALGFRVVKEL